MKKVLWALVAMAATALAAIMIPATANAVQDRPDRAGLQQQLDNVVAASGVGALAEVHDQHGIWRGTSGVSELGKKRAVPTNGRFRIGSITKTFVATVVLQLVDEGQLGLDDTVESQLPGVVPNGNHMTVRHLLNHTSGLYDVVRTLPPPPTQEFLDNRWRTWTTEELIQRAVANPPTFSQPGSAFAYSNTDYLVLGQIIQKVTGQSYGKEIERRVIRPLRLTDTELPGTSPRLRGPHPHGYVPTGMESELLDFTEMNPSVFNAAGDMISTTKDLNRFFAVLLSGGLLPDHLLSQMKEPGIQGGEYGLGLMWRDTPCGVQVYGHDGDVLAYQSWSFSTTDGKRQVTVGLTPNFRGDSDDYIDAFLNEALCGQPREQH